VLRVLERNHIPIHCVAGVSAGSIVAAAFASGATAEEIGKIGCSMRFADVARFSLCRMGFVDSVRMARFLRKLLKSFRFEELRIPPGVVATDISTGEPVMFRTEGDVVLPIRASCSYPGLFQPVPYKSRLLVDGAMSMEVPALAAREMGATHVISMNLPMQGIAAQPRNVFQVVNRCFQIMQSRTESDWRRHSDLVISPNVHGMQWDCFGSAMQLIDAGEQAALEALPQIHALLNTGHDAAELFPNVLSSSTAPLQA
jgi:NTE family protein